MVRYTSSLVSPIIYRWCRDIGVFIGGMMLLAGCQQTGPMVTDLPSPSFAGPVAMVPPKPRITQPLPPIVPPLVKPAPPKIAQSVPKDWVPPVAPRAWKAIVIHHSATPGGGAARFDRDHREKGWDELGYDFVIGNGTDTADGLIEVGPRWIKQKVGAHAKTPDNWFNERGIGICLVGDFDRERPTAAQMRSLSKIVAFMMKQYQIPADHIVGHGDTKATDCPGRHLSVADVRSLAVRVLAATGEPAQANEPRTAGEMLVDLPRK